MALPSPHGFAKTQSGEVIDLAQPRCHVDTVDLCPEARVELASVLKSVRDHLSQP